MKRYILFLFFVAACLIIDISCKKPSDTADSGNPYNGINNNVTTHPTNQQIDSNSITGLYTFIFSQKCAIPSCHGKMFEPNFSSVEASYNTLVYHKVIKNTADGRFVYRVIPGDTVKSWLHERLVTDDSILGRMPRYQHPLSQREMYHINKWILDGAKDVNNQTVVQPNANVFMQEIIVYDAMYHRVDTVRATYYAPFTVPSNSLLHIYFYVYDAETKVADFLDNKAKFSTDPNNFSSAVIASALYDTTYKIWHFDINSNNFPTGKQIYVRYYARDPDHTTDAERPNASSPYYEVNHFSFFVK